MGAGRKRPRVIRAGDAVGAVPAAVQERLEVHRGDRPVLFHSGFHPHERRVAPAVAVKDLLAGEGDLYGPAGEHRELRHDDLVAERVALTAEAAAVGDRKSTRLNSSHSQISYAVFCLKKKKTTSCSMHPDSCTRTSAPINSSLTSARLPSWYCHSKPYSSTV